MNSPSWFNLLSSLTMYFKTNIKNLDTYAGHKPQVANALIFYTKAHLEEGNGGMLNVKIVLGFYSFNTDTSFISHYFPLQKHK